MKVGCFSSANSEIIKAWKKYRKSKKLKDDATAGIIKCWHISLKPYYIYIYFVHNNEYISFTIVKNDVYSENQAVVASNRNLKILKNVGASPNEAMLIKWQMGNKARSKCHLGRLKANSLR